MKAIRGFVDFDYDLRKPLSSASKGKINKYFEYINDKVGDNDSNIYVYRGRKKKNIETAKAATGAPPELKGLKTAFFPTVGKEIDIRFDRKGELTIKGEFVTSKFIQFDPLRLIADDSKEYIQSLIDKHNYEKYNITYGEWDSPSMPDSRIAETVSKLAAEYNVKGNHNYKNWLFGVNGLKFSKQGNALDYQKEKKAAILARKRKAKANRKKKK